MATAGSPWTAAIDMAAKSSRQQQRSSLHSRHHGSNPAIDAKNSATSRTTTKIAASQMYFAGRAVARCRCASPSVAEAASGGVSPGGTDPPGSRPGVRSGSGPGGSSGSRLVIVFGVAAFGRFQTRRRFQARRRDRARGRCDVARGGGLWYSIRNARRVTPVNRVIH